MVNDEFYMSLALKEAWKYQLLTYPNPAVGALITDSKGKILSIAAHKKKGFAHAELECIKEAYAILSKDGSIEKTEDPFEIHDYILKHHDNLFEECKIYVTLEPCSHTGSTPSCSSLIKALNFKEVVIGSAETNPIAKGGADLIGQSGIKVKKGCLKKECDLLIEPFLLWSRGNFVFFKCALNLNGTYDTGIISCYDSRKFVHRLRELISLLVIGGNSVRVDRPTLDSRYVGGRAPDVLIYSKRKEFDKNIPLFLIPDRKVFVEDSLESVKRYSFVMIEGAHTLLKESEKFTDWYLFFISSDMKKGKHIDIDKSFEIIHTSFVGRDILIWAKAPKKH